MKGKNILAEEMRDSLLVVSDDFDDFKGLLVELGEIGIDGILENETFKQIPIVNTIIALTKTGLVIREKRFLKKFLVFILELNEGRVDEDKRNQFKENLRNDKKYATKIFEFLNILIDAFIEEEKSRVLANLLNNHIDEKYDWEYFCWLAISLTNAHPIVFEALHQLSVKNKDLSQSFKTTRDGFAYEYESMLFSTGLVYNNGTHFLVNIIGKDLYKYGVSCLYKNR